MSAPPARIGEITSPPDDPLRDGLPMGVHFLARFGDEATLFRLAAQLESPRPWASRRPPVFAG